MTERSSRAGFSAAIGPIPVTEAAENANRYPTHCTAIRSPEGGTPFGHRQGLVRRLGDSRNTNVDAVIWHAKASDSRLPAEQTLERLVCAAWLRCHPARFEAVHRWLGDRPEATPTGSKNYVWSFIAGWYADHGGEAFLRELWHDEDLKAHLGQMLTECGALAIIEAIEGRGAH